MPNHTVESMKYITTLPDIDRERANEVLTAASRLVGTEELDKLIKIGASEGTKGGLAAQSLLLVRLAYEYRGHCPIKEFAKAQKKELKQYHRDKSNFEIRNLLKNRPPQLSGSQERCYRAQNSEQPQHAYLRDALPADGGPLVVRTKYAGEWVYSNPHSNAIWTADFSSDRKLIGIYTEGAAGGCVPVAFCYGGSLGEPYRVIKMVHIQGGDYEKVTWDQMKIGEEQPTSIVIYAYVRTDDLTFRGLLSFLEGKHYARRSMTVYSDHGGDNSGSGILAVDKWGHFGTFIIRNKDSRKETKEWDKPTLHSFKPE